MTSVQCGAPARHDGGASLERALGHAGRLWYVDLGRHGAEGGEDHLVCGDAERCLRNLLYPVVLPEEIIRILRLEPGMPLTGAWTEKEWEKLLRCVVSAFRERDGEEAGMGDGEGREGSPACPCPTCAWLALITHGDS